MMHIKEIEKVSLLEPFDRYKYFLKKVADSELLYILEKDSSYAVSSLDNNYLFPIWSAKEFAELCKINGWEDFSISEITLEDFENEIIDVISNKNYLINVFPVLEKTGYVVSLDEFARDLSDELKNY